jgi:serralysin
VIVEGNYTGVVRTLIAAATIENYRIESTGSSLLNVTGNVLTNFLTGNDANNVLSDGGFGGNGDDIIRGGAGNDTLTGGADADTFWFDTAANATTNKDMITDFVSGTDKLQFSVSGLAALGATGRFSANDQRFWSSATGITHDVTDRLIYNTIAGALSYDSNGSAAGGAVIIELLGIGNAVETDIYFV